MTETPAVDWETVDSLIADQKFQSALETVKSLIDRAVEDEDSEQWTRALVESAKLQVALHGYETAVKDLIESPWPPDPASRAILDLYAAQTMVVYAQAYGWEIRSRERVVSDEVVDLERWTMDQIVAAANRSYSRLWSERDQWGDAPLGDFSRYLNQNNYPARVRGTLRDAISYLWVDLMADTSLWRPEQSAEIYRLDLAALQDGEPAIEASELSDTRVHPLLRIALVLGDLERWHAPEQRTEAALEARYERIGRLRDSVTNLDDRVLLRSGLQKHLESIDPQFEWWSMGQALVAEMLRGEDRPTALIEARDAALTGLERHSEGLAAMACNHHVKAIESPAYSIDAMAVDGIGRRSLRVTHRNIGAVFFRAWEVDLDEVIRTGRDYNLLPGYREVPEYLENKTPAAEWSIDLPETPDFRSHHTDGVPPLNQKGVYLVAASARSDFKPSDNLRMAFNFIVSDLVLLSRPIDGRWEITARSGFQGDALADVELELYKADWQRGHHRIGTYTTGDDGRASINILDHSNRNFLVGRIGDDVALLSHLGSAIDHSEGTSTAAFVYTDRSAYRPLQTIHWKIVPFRGGGEDHRWETLPLVETQVFLVDANGDEVARETVTTNAFGSASGSFEIPAGRLLGEWRIRTIVGDASSTIRVEEYKRPTFTVEVSEPASEIRLNRPAELRGSVAYYFGLPVAEGDVRWRITREPVYPRWWYWWRPMPTDSSRVVASGEAVLNPDGTFTVSFTPQADEREAERGVTYRFRLAVDVTDPGGETRSASRSFRLGFTAVEASVDLQKGFLPAGSANEVVITRTDLDGAPRKGRAAWRVVRLDQPNKTLTPARQPLPIPDDGDEYLTEGDRTRTRWRPNYDPQQVMASWPEGREVAAGSLDHGDDGIARLALDDLRPGPYRLIYSTEDSFGAAFEHRTQFVVADAKSTRLALPAFLGAEQGKAVVGETARLFVHSGFPGQTMVLELFRGGRRFDRRVLRAGRDPQLVNIAIDDSLRGGFGASLTVLHDHQVVTQTADVFVPWDDRELKLEFATFRDTLRPGGRETFRVTVRNPDGDSVDRDAAEVLAYMYDRSLDIFADHHPPKVSRLYPSLTGSRQPGFTLGAASSVWQDRSDFGWVPPLPSLRGDRLRMLDGYGIGGPGSRGGQWVRMKSGAMRQAMVPAAAMMDADSVAMSEPLVEGRAEEEFADEIVVADTVEEGPVPEVEMRANFAETAFFEPHLKLEDDGAVTIEFDTPDSVTEWNLWVHAVTTDLRGASEERQVRTVKELMVRPAVPRFLREGDQAGFRVVVNNAGDEPLEGVLRLELTDPETGEDLRSAFGIDVDAANGSPFEVDPGAGTTLVFDLLVPPRPGVVNIQVTAQAGDFSDGELRPLPVLPGRMHLLQSRFAALKDADRRELHFADMAASDDPSLINQQLVVSIDAQLFYGVLDAMPYLVEYPYECTEQTLNRFLSTGIVTSVFDRYPAVAEMAERMAVRDTRLESWDAEDPNRKLALEETPWLVRSRGGDDAAENLIRVLDPAVADAQRRTSLGELKKVQTSLGAFPWWPGGPPSPYMTLYVLSGFSHALEFGVDVPKDVVQEAWEYMHRHYLDELVGRMLADDCCWETVTWLNFVLSSYPDESWTGGLFTVEDRRRMLEHSFSKWKHHSPRIKSYLALTLDRMGRPEDARLVWESVMDSAKTDPDLGTYWAPEERGWLWYNDTVESHAVALRTLTELDPDDERRLGLVQWIFLNKKLSHWSNTRTTAEVVYSLVHYLEQENQLGVEENATVTIGPIRQEFVFDPEEFTGKDARVVIPGESIDPATMATTIVEKTSPGIAFATATWLFSTERLPEHGDGDLFSVERTYYRRSLQGDEWILEPLAEGAPIAVGDQLEVELRIKARHAAEFVHLRDPRGAGFEPEKQRSGWRWDLGVAAYEEIRDSGSNFFFEWLPAGEYAFRYRVRAAMGGAFKVAPAVLQSMYAPEFGAYSAGHTLEVLQNAD